MKIMSSIETIRYKMVLFGNAGVGKTSLVERFVNNKFQANYISTLGYNVYEKQISYKNNILSLMVYDIGGQEQFRDLRKKYAEGASTGFLVYDITDGDSFKTLPNWKKDLDEFTTNVSFIIIGNKIDLEESRQVSEEDAKQFASEIGALDFFETSAKSGHGVEKAFHQLAVKKYETFYGKKR